MNIQILGPADGLAALASVHALCAWRLFFLFGLSILRNPRLGESELRVVGGDAATAEGKMDDSEGIRTCEYARCSPSWSSVAIDEESAMLSCSRNANPHAVLYTIMMAGLFWWPAYVCPGRMLGSLPLLQPCFFLLSLLYDQQQRQSLHRGTTGCAAAAVVRPSFVPRLVTEAGRRAGRRCRPPTQLPVAYASAM